MSDMNKDYECTDMANRVRNDVLLNSAYNFGRYNGLDELEILKRFTLMLLYLKDEAMQEKLNELLLAPQKEFYKRMSREQNK